MTGLLGWGSVHCIKRGLIRKACKDNFSYGTWSKYSEMPFCYDRATLKWPMKYHQERSAWFTNFGLKKGRFVWKTWIFEVFFLPWSIQCPSKWIYRNQRSRQTYPVMIISPSKESRQNKPIIISTRKVNWTAWVCSFYYYDSASTL